MKKHFSLMLSFLLVLSLLLSCSVFALAEAEVAEEKPAEAGAFDLALVGAWKHEKTEEAGQDGLNLVRAMEGIQFFLFDGTVSVDTGEFRLLAVNGLDQLRIEAADGATNVGEVLPAFWLNLLKVGAGIPGAYITEDWIAEVEGELSKVQDLNVTYEASAEELVLHVTGTYKESPLASAPIDTTLSFTRSDDIEAWFDAYLCGSWTDANGNAWDFRFEQDEKGYIYLTGSLTDPAGTVYNGKADIVYVNREKGTIEFSFEEFDSPEYQVSPEADHLYLSSDKGDVDMTRN